ncbi:hypothetical protein FDC27_00395 [Clostridium botulinum]|nr:hypothetical protein [Clostridium botulinum]
MYIIKTELDFLKQDIKEIKNDAKKIDEKVISKVKYHYKRRENEYLKNKLIILKNQIEAHNDINIISIMALIVTIISLITTSLISAHNMVNNESYNIADKTIEQVNKYNEANDENRKIIFSYIDMYDKDLKEAHNNNDFDKVKEIENTLNSIPEYKQANIDLTKNMGKTSELCESSKTRLKEISSKWYILMNVIFILVLIMISIIICTIHYKNKKNKNISNAIQIDVIKQILNNNY